MSEENNKSVLEDAQSIVSKWMNASINTSSTTNNGNTKKRKLKEIDQIENNQKVIPRPARLGLGAKFLPHRIAMNSLEMKVQKKIQKQKTKQESEIGREKNESDEDSGKEESKTSVFSKRNQTRDLRNIAVSKKKKK
eukprot:c8214_g1_i1.p1 GENE.c8214_g1_i1~~c8214_g1_i1.p1  ORF type:complete len:137 (+),score=45.75 c8214_g1_i1:51-461(+)